MNNNKNLPLISVIIPVYNVEKYLNACVESILKQDYENYEIILVDDSSKDSSFDICNQLADSHDNIFSYRISNSGAAGARNHGIDMCHGQFVTFVDSDDLVTSDFLSYMYGLIKQYDADVAVCGYLRTYNRGIKEDTGKEFKNCYERVDAVKNLLYQRHFISSPWAMLSKRSLWDDLRFPIKRAEDMATIYRLFNISDRVAYGSKKNYMYIQNSSSTIYSITLTFNKFYYDNCLEMVEYIEEQLPEVLPAARSRLFSACYQILSETAITSENSDFIKTLKKTINENKSYILKDPEGKPRNRIAAALSYLSIGGTQRLLRLYYIAKRKLL